MSVDYRNSERRRYVNDLPSREKEIAAVLKVSSPGSPKAQQQLNDKRVRREIANGNERRRMQCINAGFNSLRALIPLLEGEKLSKAAILQQSIDYITTLEKDKSRLQMQLERTKHLLAEAELGQQDRVLVDSFVANTPPSKRKKRDTESSDEGVGSLSDASDDYGADLRQRNEALRHQMDKEKRRGDSLDEENRSLRNLIYLIQKQSARDQQPITLVTAAPPQEPTRVRDVVEIMSPRLDYTPPPMKEEVMEYSIVSQPVSLTVDSTITMTPKTNVTRIIEPVTVVSGVQMELRDTPSADYLTNTSLPMVCSPSPSADNVITSTNAAQSSESAFLHNYAHRDHPRRRRHQAQLEKQRIEEEERQQKEQEELQLRLQQQQQLQSLSSTNTYVPRHSVRSLDILAEAANHVKDDQSNNRLYEDNIGPLQISHPIVYQISDDTTDRLSAQQDIYESNERLSPSSTTLLTSPSHHLQSLHQDVITSHCPIIVTSATSDINRSSFSEKYPIATHLLHRPLHTPFTRPGVIVQKH